MIDLVATLRRNLSRALARRDLRDASGIVDQLEIEDPLSLETRCMRLEFLTLARRSDEARALARQLLQLHAGSARVHYVAGRLALEERRYAEAVARLSESVRIAPHWRSRLWLGRALSRQGKLEEAEAALIALLAERPEAALDLAFVYERRGDDAQALEVIDRYIARGGNAPQAHAQRLRLRARSLPPEDLVREMEDLESLGEEAPADLLPAYADALLRLGKGDLARQLAAARREALAPRDAAALGFALYRLQAYDAAYDLLLHAFRSDRRYRSQQPLLRSLERSAELHGRVPDLVEIYRSFASEDRWLYGRMKSLRPRSPSRRPSARR